MSYFDGVPGVLLYAGPPANYPAAAASSAAAQDLMTGATGDYSIPYIPQGFLQQGKIGMAVEGHFGGVLTGQSSATTATITIGALAAGSYAGSISGTTLVASGAITVTSLTGVGWELDTRHIIRAVGWGTTSVSTSVESTAVFSVGSNLQAVAVPNSVTNLDASQNWYLYATVTFSTSSTTNSCTLESVMLMGWA